MSATLLITLKKFPGWLRKNILLVTIFLLINLCIVILAYTMQMQSDHPELSQALESWHRYFVLFGVMRVLLELYLFFNWRLFVAWLRKVFRLGYRKTWFIYQCRKIFKLFIIFDIGTFILLNLV